MRIGSISKILTPGYTWCERCETTWKFVEPHIIEYTDEYGYFALCEKCWDESDIATRLHYLHWSFAIWGTPKDANLIEEAVLENR